MKIYWILNEFKLQQISLCDYLSSLQLPAGEQRRSARRWLPHLPVGGEGADQTLPRPQLFSPGERKRVRKNPGVGGERVFFLFAIVQVLLIFRKQLQFRQMWCWLTTEAAECVPVQFFTFLQNSQSGSEKMESCDGARPYPPTAPIMLQVIWIMSSDPLTLFKHLSIVWKFCSFSELFD